MNASTNTTTKPDLLGELERLEEEIERTNERIEQFGEEELQELADIYERFTAVLDRYEEDVTDDGGDIRTNIEFQSAIAEVVADVPDGMLLTEAFEECDERLQKRWFHDSDFEFVYEQLEPVGDLVARLEERDEAITAYRETRRDVRYRIRDLKEEIAELERLARLSDADLDAPTDRLREPTERYNEAVTEAFAQFRRDAPAREVIDFVDAMAAYPLVPFEQPDDELASYVREYPPGNEPISKLQEYASYSHSKLSHYVDDPEQLTHVVGRKKTYLDGLNAEALTIDWPPPPAERLQWRCRELTAAVNRFAPDVVEHLRAVAALPRETDYDRIRDSAVVRETLTADERERIQSGDIETELSRARNERRQLEQALETFPDR